MMPVAKQDKGHPASLGYIGLGAGHIRLGRKENIPCRSPYEVCQLNLRVLPRRQNQE
jgi:hypothetical protein